jgi:hypothetical protein
MDIASVFKKPAALCGAAASVIMLCWPQAPFAIPPAVHHAAIAPIDCRSDFSVALACQTLLTFSLPVYSIVSSLMNKNSGLPVECRYWKNSNPGITNNNAWIANST